MKTIVVSDLHGDWQGLIAILRATGGIDAENRRLPGTNVIQLGDCIHGGDPRGAPREGVDDELCAALALGLCDTILIGNHELPHLWPDAGFPIFGGQRPIGDRLRAALLTAYHGGQLVPAYAHEHWLLTHAGLYPDLALAQGVAKGLAKRLRIDFADRIERGGRWSIFDGVGLARGGRTDEFGGIFWLDWGELTRAGNLDTSVSQIVGHTPQKVGYARAEDSWCVDAGAALSGRVSAIVQDEGGGEWRPVVVSSVEDT